MFFSHLSAFSESEEALLKMSVSQPESGVTSLPDFSSMTEEEQIAYAMQMSLAGGGSLALFMEITSCFHQVKELIKFRLR